MIDIHSHLLPGLDDGAKDIEEALAMARIAVDQGITGIVATPHFMEDELALPADLVLTCTKNFQNNLNEADIKLSVYPGMEAYITPALGKLAANGCVLTINNNQRYLLVELPFADIPVFADDVLFSLMLAGITPVLAHPERNMQLTERPDTLARWVERGVLVQLNGASLTGSHGPKAQRTAELFLLRNLVHCVATDAHSSQKRRPMLAAARERVRIICDEAKAAELFYENPQRLIRGEEIPIQRPKAASRFTVFSKRLHSIVSTK